ncbi:hypothetical protein B0H16DRAFT_1881125 [Mycena metata]|uniref:F-box domain-containing protein n=1 Tax=Mycena metata TaxID=1033252 RepID=A0AAD7JTD5_9AGAR|nr:hypothetical protein B0H16DRAFT_1881125 [Mycena metata]
MAIHLLDLPPELLILILSSFDLLTLTSCLATNRRVKSIIDGSTLLQYRLAAQAACIEDNPWSPDIDIAQKLLALQKQQNINDLDNCVYTLSGNVFAVADLDTRVFRWISLAATELVLQRLELPGYIQNITLAISEEDLLVVALSSKPLGNQPFASDVVFELRFYQMSTQSAHPMAREPVIHIPILGTRCPHMFECATCGSKCALVITYFDVDDEPQSRTLVYDWKLGGLLKSLDNSSTTVFLSPDVILSRRDDTETFEMWTMSEVTAAGPNVSLLLSPPAEDGIYHITSISSEPGGNESSASQEPFHPSFADSNVAFKIDVFSFTNNSEKRLVLVIPRRALLQLLPSVADRGKVLLWKEWGPPIAQWLNEDPKSFPKIYGQYCAFVGSSGRIQLANFNPHAFKKALKTNIDDLKQRAIQAGSKNAEVRSNLGYLVAESAQETAILDPDDLQDMPAHDNKKSIDIWYFG